MTYQEMITDATKCTPEEAALAENWMRLELGTLDWVDRRRFNREAKTAVMLVRECPKETATLATTYGRRS